MTSQKMKVALSRVELAAADMEFENARLKASCRDLAASLDALGAEMTIAFAAAGALEDDEGFLVPELIEASAALEWASVELQLISQAS